MMDIVFSFASTADGGNIQGVARRYVARPTQHMAGNDIKSSCSECGCFQEFCPGQEMILLISHIVND